MSQQQQIDELRAALRDIAFGAAMMMQPPSTGVITRYAAEVRRVAEAALGAPVRLEVNNCEALHLLQLSSSRTP